MASGPSTAWQIEGEKVEVVTDCFFLASKITITDGDCSQRQCVEKQRHYSANKGLCSQGYGLLSGHILLWELDCKEGRAPKHWYLWTMLLEKTSESPWDSKEIKPVNLKGDQLWICVGRDWCWSWSSSFWSSDAKSWLTGKDPDVGKDWRQEKGVTEDELVGWHHWLNGHEFEQTPGDSEEQGSLACYSPWGSQRVRHDWMSEQQQIIPDS